MKILVVTQYFWPEQFKVNDLCSGLIERGHEVTVYTGLPNYPAGQFFKGYSYLGPYKEINNKVKIIRVPLIPRMGNKGLNLAINYFSFCLFSTLLAPFLVRGNYDKIFIYQVSPVFASLPAIFLKYLKKAPVILWVADLWPDSLSATGAVKNKFILDAVAKFVQFIYSRSDKIFISSRGFQRKIEQMGVKTEKIKFWPQWAENFFDNKESSGDYADDRIPGGFIVMFAGNIGSAQDFATIVNAATILKNNEGIKFVILGDGLMKDWAEKEVVARNLTKTFIFLGRKPVETMPYYYSKADAMLVSLTDTELFSITIPAKVQTYLASGRPIIASLNGEGADIINEWHAGLSCRASRPGDLAATIEKIASFPKDKLEEMGANAYKCYKSEFEREKLISILEHEFQSLN